MTDETAVQKIVEAAKLINQFHAHISKEWLATVKAPINLKSKQIRHVFNDELKLEQSFMQYVDYYCDFLSEQVTFDDTYTFLLNNFPMRSRIKEPNSRIPKLYHYLLNKGEDGKVNLNKCLNDLMGFRILVENFDHTTNTEQRLKELLVEAKGIKVHNSSKDNYEATHIYFHNGNNRYFPWEFQIWCINDQETNILSHKKYKQSYTTWPHIFIDKGGE